MGVALMIKGQYDVAAIAVPWHDWRIIVLRHDRDLRNCIFRFF